MQPDGYLFPHLEGEPSQYEIARAARKKSACEIDGSYFSADTTEKLLLRLEVAELTITNAHATGMKLFDSSPTYGSFNLQFGSRLGRMIHYPAFAVSFFEQGQEAFRLLKNLPSIEGYGESVVSTYIDLLKRIGIRGANDTLPSSILVGSGENDNFRQASCHHAEAKYVDAALESGLEIEYLNGLPFWRKEVGERSFLNLTPVMHKGIELAPGWIFARTPDLEGNYRHFPVRPSAFMFATEVAKEAFSDALEMVEPDWYRALKNEFDATVKHFADKAASDYCPPRPCYQAPVRQRIANYAILNQ